MSSYPEYQPVPPPPATVPVPAVPARTKDTSTTVIWWIVIVFSALSTLGPIMDDLNAGNGALDLLLDAVIVFPILVLILAALAFGIRWIIRKASR